MPSTKASSTTPTKQEPVDHSYITRLPTFADRGKAIAERLDDIKKNPKYTALPPEKQAHLRGMLYDQLVPASYAGFHLPVPDKATWVNGTAHSTDVQGNTGPSYHPELGQKLADSYGPNQNPLRNFDLQGDKLYSNMTMYGAKIANNAFSSLYGVAQHFTQGPYTTSAPAKPEPLFMASKDVKGLLKPGNININDRPLVQNGKDTSTVWSASFGTDNGTILLPRVSDGEDGKAPHLMSEHESWNYYKKYGKSLGTFKDDASADAYGEALHEQQAGLGQKNGRTIVKSTSNPIAQARPSSDIGFGIKQVLYTAQKAAQNVQDAAYSRVQSDDFWIQTHPAETKIGNLVDKSGEVVAGLPLWEALGATGVGGVALRGMESTPLTARLLANPAGKVIAHRLISASAAYGATVLGTGGDTHEAAKMAEGDILLGGYIDAAKGAFRGGQALRVASSTLAKKWTASVVAEAGRPFAEDLATSAANEEEHAIASQESGTEHPSTAMVLYRKEADPVMHTLHQSEKISLNSIAVKLYGKPLRGISKNQRLAVLEHRTAQIGQAAAEAPVHLPEQLHEQIEGNIKAERAADPQLHALMSQDEQMFGAKFADVYTDNATQAVAKDTGISNQRGAARSIAKSEASLSKGDDISPRKFASLGMDSSSYLRAPRDRSDVSFIGQRSKDAYDKTYQLLKQADGGFFRAERPVQRFLYHYADKGKLPAGLRQSVLHWIKETPGYSGKTEQQIFQEAKNLRVTMYDMAKSGRLKHEGNLFASTKTEGPMSWSPWQAPLSNESDQQVIKAAQKALARHPETLKGYNAMVKMIQKSMVKTNTPEELQALKDQLDKGSRGIATHLSRGTAKVGY